MNQNFVDWVRVRVKAGDGGDGGLSLLRQAVVLTYLDMFFLRYDLHLFTYLYQIKAKNS